MCVYHVVYRTVFFKVHKNFIKFIKKIIDILYNIKGIFILNLEYLRLMTNLIITYLTIFNKTS